MNQTMLIIVLLGLGASACTQDADAVKSPAAPLAVASNGTLSGLPPALQTFSPRTLTPVESAIIDSIAALNPAGAALIFSS